VLNNVTWVFHHSHKDWNLKQENVDNALDFTHSWSRALLEKPPIVQQLKNFPAFYGTRRYITVFTRALH
jgi:hypothetical protein